MSKSILVMEMPKSCEKCPILFAGRYCKGKKAPNIAVDSYFDKTKPNWCPLKEVPKKKKDTLMTNYSRYVQGWNDCIDRILEGSEEDERLD